MDSYLTPGVSDQELETNKAATMRGKREQKLKKKRARKKKAKSMKKGLMCAVKIILYDKHLVFIIIELFYGAE